MKILLVWPVAEFSIWDVAAGIKAGLLEEGHEVHDFFYNKRFAYHRKAIGDATDGSDPDEVRRRHDWIARQASETLLAESVYSQCDAVVVVSGLSFHPNGLALLATVRPDLPVAIVLTESPYEDDQQASFVSAHPNAVVFTNEYVSAIAHGWHFLPHAINPAVHRQTPPRADLASDVLFIGSGWGERTRMFESVDWSGIQPRIIGPFPDLTPDSPIARFVENFHVVDNPLAAEYYAAAKIVLNFHRAHPVAQSVNPRVREVTACGSFLLTDRRAELDDLFAPDTVGIFENGLDLGIKVRYFLEHDAERRDRAERARMAMLSPVHHFRRRAATVADALMRRAAVASVR